MFRSENTGGTLNDNQPNRLDIEERSPSPISQDHTRVSNTASPYVTAAALDDVKNSIQELRSILLRISRGAQDEEANELEMDQRGRDPRRSDEVHTGEPNGDTTGTGAVPPPPQGRPRVRVQSPRPASPVPSPVIHQGPTRPTSFSPTYVVDPYTGSQPYNPASWSRPTVYPGYDTYAPATGVSRYTDAASRELQSVISDFSTIVIIATFLASVSIVMLDLARNVYDSPILPKSSLNNAFNVILQVFASLALSFNLSVAIVAGSAASSQSLRLRLGQRASVFSRSQSLDTKLQLCTTMQYYGLLCLTVATACIFALLLNSPYAVLIIIPVVGVVFYDSLFRGKVSSTPAY